MVELADEERIEVHTCIMWGKRNWAIDNGQWKRVVW